MCNSPDCQHLDDDLSDIFGAPTTADVARGVEILRTQKIARFEEGCPACRGTGRFRSYSGNIVGDCFKCNGKGVLFFKTTLENREKARAGAERRRNAVAASKGEQARAWLEANPAEAEWLRAGRQSGFEFAVSMGEALLKYGAFTERQEAAVRSATAKRAARLAQWAAEAAARDANKADVDIGRIAEALAAAKASKLRWPKLRLADFVFSPAPDTGRNAGAIYVKTHDDVYLGKIADGKFTRSRDCTAALEAGIVAAAADPLAAAVAYGKQTGECSCCGRELTNELSISLGIGPVCRDKWGWS